MKKEYMSPVIKKIEFDYETVLAASGILDKVPYTGDREAVVGTMCNVNIYLTDRIPVSKARTITFLECDKDN